MRLYLLFILGYAPSLIFGQAVDSSAIKQVDSLLQISYNLVKEGAYDDALAVTLRAEKTTIEKIGQESASYGACCHYHSLSLEYTGDYPEAEKWLLEALRLREKFLGKESDDYARSLNNLAKLYWEMGDFEKSEPLFLETLVIEEKIMGKENYSYAKTMDNLGNLYADMGYYEKAESNYLIAKDITERIMGKDNPAYCGNLVNLGTLNVELGNYDVAEPLFLEAKDIFENTLQDRTHPFYVNDINGLAVLYAAVGNYEKAEQFALQANHIWGETVGNGTPDYAMGLLNLASLYCEMGKFDQAEPLYYEASSIFEKELGKEIPDYSLCLNNLANSYLETANYAKAEPLFLEALALRKKVLGKEHPDYASSLFNLASLYYETSNYKKAEPLFLEALAIQDKVLGKQHPDYALSLHNLGSLYLSMGNYEKATAFFTEFATLNRTLISRAVRHLSEKELHTYLDQFKDRDYATMLSFAQILAKKQRSFAAVCYNNSLFYKGFLLQAVNQVKRLALSNPVAAEKFNQLKSLERRLAAEYALPEADRTKMSELENQASALEKDLARTVAGYGEAMRQVSWEEVQQTLKPGEAAIEFVQFRFNEKKPTDSLLYAALVLLSGTQKPVYLPLFEEKDLKSLLSRQGKTQTDQINALYAGNVGNSLYSLVWQPLEKVLSGVKTVYFSPEGLLHKLNFGAMAIPATVTTDHPEPERLADRFQLFELGSTRQLVSTWKQSVEGSGPLLYGGIQYDLDSTSIVAENSDRVNLSTASNRGIGFANTDSTLRGGTWKYLKWTAVEIEAAAAVLQDAGLSATMFKGYGATEESVKSIGVAKPSPRILHLATHGYFFPDPKSLDQSSRASNSSGTGFKRSDLPMIRSGLILAGGNYAWQKGKPIRPNKEDGILTAYEISQLNLSNTELVVLSACETGLGEIQGTEGVYGLQRAFKIAGAKYLIMSLWTVPDYQTQELMTAFYSHWLLDKMTIQEAFGAAQKAMRDKYKAPFLWAGFVLVE